MTHSCSITQPAVWVAIDVAKLRHDVLVQLPSGMRKHLKLNSTLADFQRLAAFLHGCGSPCLVGFEPTGDYHRPLAHFLHLQGFSLCMVSSIAVARTREARYNSWDKNDPKDCQVILHLMQTGTTQIYNDPLVSNYNDLQEMANTYQRVSLLRVQLHHTIFTHYLPLYFPEAERYCHNSRAEWFTQLLLLTPCPKAVLAYSKQEFVEKAAKLSGRKVDKQRLLADFYEAAISSIALPVTESSEAISCFRVVLQQYLNLCRLRRQLEVQVQARLADHADFNRLQTIPGIGPILAMIILAEAGDLRRFSHHRKFLKYCGLDLCTSQSGQFRGQPKLSKRGNARLRYAFWMAGTTALRMRQNGFRRKYEDYIRRDPLNADVRRKAYTAIAAKMARVVYGVIKSGTDYRRFDEAAVPGGRIHSLGP
jgi:transposase